MLRYKQSVLRTYNKLRLQNVEDIRRTRCGNAGQRVEPSGHGTEAALHVIAGTADGSAKDFIIKSLVLPCASLDSPCHILPTPPALHHILACSTTYSQLTACYPILHLPPTTLDRDSPSSGLSSSSGSPYHSPPPSPLVTRFAHPFTGQHLLPWCALIL